MLGVHIFIIGFLHEIQQKILSKSINTLLFLLIFTSSKNKAQITSKHSICNTSTFKFPVNVHRVETSRVRHHAKFAVSKMSYAELIMLLITLLAVDVSRSTQSCINLILGFFFHTLGIKLNARVKRL